MTLVTRTKNGEGHNVISVTNGTGITIYADIYNPTNEEEGFVRQISKETANKIIGQYKMGEPVL